MKLIHETGFAYNDLRLRNIIIDADCIKLIDFGNCNEIYDFEGNHIQNLKRTTFKGNIVLASHNVMNFMQASRKDDLVSLVYLILSLNDDFKIIKIDTAHMQPLEYFKHVASLKKEITVEEYCTSPEAKLL